MATHDRLDILGKQVNLLNDFAKFAGVMVLALFILGAYFFPTWVNDHLKALGIKLAGGSFGGINFVATETVKANGNAIELANALTATEIKLVSMISTFDAAKTANGAPAVGRAEVENALKNVRSAQQSLDQQSIAISRTGEIVGATQSIPESGWIYVGYYGDDATLKWLSDRLEKTQQVLQSGRDIKEIVLAYDAPVVSDGNICNKVDIASVPTPDPNAPEREYTIVRGSPLPLKVLAQIRCPAAGKGSMLYAQVSVPKDRIRIAKLSTIVRRAS